MNSVEQKECSNCGAIFSCGAESEGENCWCAQLRPVPIVANKNQDCFCPKCLREEIQELEYDNSSAERGFPVVTVADVTPSSSLVEGRDYYLAGEFVVFTELYHLRRGYCCENDCRHCPYRAS